MNIIPATITITEFSIKLSAEDAREAVDSPYVFADKLAEQLRAVGVVPTANGNGRHKPSPDHPLGYKAHAARKARAAKRLKPAKAAKPAKAGRPNGEKGGPSLERLQCPHCSRKIARKFMPNHLASKHGTLATASDVKSDSTE